ncbi:hypothetical protein EDC64_109165 [Aquabacter spiritensis]|uniref:Uncharacterized protein n=1 Tax=Aquabacter spiritensis TaxID=933073 RepID=A0A4R3LY06_9HYPH|nr:hypothetical protein EDC64_109165 [Aquabacter spiritensis]
MSEEERDAFHLHGLLPPHASILDEQISAALAVAMQAHREGAAPDVPVDQIPQRLRAQVWTPRPVPLIAKGTLSPAAAPRAWAQAYCPQTEASLLTKPPEMARIVAGEANSST